MTKAGPLPSGGVLAAHRQQYYEPLGLPPGTNPFHLRLIGTASPDVGDRGGSLLFRVGLSLRASLNTPGTSCTHPDLLQVQSVAFAVT